MHNVVAKRRIGAQSLRRAISIVKCSRALALTPKTTVKLLER